MSQLRPPRLEKNPGDALLHALLGVAHGYLGHGPTGDGRAAALKPLAKDAFQGAYLQHQLPRIYALVEETDQAVLALEPLLRVAYYLSPGWLRVDPPLRRCAGIRDSSAWPGREDDAGHGAT